MDLVGVGVQVRVPTFQLPETETDRAADENGLALGDYKRVAIS